MSARWISECHLYTVGLQPFRFGVMNFGTSREEWLNFARRAEDLGFATLVVSDHFGKQLAPLPALMAAAAVTSRIRLGSIVLDNDFRHPAALAKEAATIDLLSQGRLEVGLGAGWLAEDYAKTGIPFEPPATRVHKLAEAVQIYKGFFANDTLTFKGQHYQINDLDCAPNAVQQPRPPLMIGGRRKRMLQLAAREADIVSISLLERDPNPPSFEQKLQWVREAAGTRLQELILHVNVNHIDATGAPEQQPAPNRLVGSLDSMCEQLHRWREACGVSYFVVPVRLMDALAPIVQRLG
jgi:probable F420-dependent oxidoreductase